MVEGWQYDLIEQALHGIVIQVAYMLWGSLLLAVSSLPPLSC